MGQSELVLPNADFYAMRRNGMHLQISYQDEGFPVTLQEGISDLGPLTRIVIFEGAWHRMQHLGIGMKVEVGDECTTLQATSLDGMATIEQVRFAKEFDKRITAP